jgi:ectoine hydroxylase-related dioxygenase (phytanoyl-CoA dioxygenase family)
MSNGLTGMLDRQQQQTFAEQGYVIVPQVVSQSSISAARREIERLLTREPPPADHSGPYFYNRTDAPSEPLCALLFDGLTQAAEALIAPGRFDAPEQVQVSLNIPPFDHRPGGPHVDGLAPPEADGRPGTFTLLAGVFLTDQTAENMGNLWVWPGSHRSAANYLRERGADALMLSSPYPPVELAEPRQVCGRAGDLLLAHYLLGHNIGGNISDTVREVVYFRLRRAGHRARWQECVRNPLLEFEPVRAAVE